MRRIQRKIETRDTAFGALGQHLEEQAAAASDVQQQALLVRFTQRALDETQVIAQHEAAIALLQMVGSGGVRSEPIVGWIVVSKFERRGLRIQSNQTALAALDDPENLVGSCVEPIPGVEQDTQFKCAAGGAGVTCG